MEEKLLSAISTVGFPIVVSCYLLVKFQATLDRFSNKVDELILELRNGYYYMNPHHPNNAA
ncbi:MAG: YvrJ family protein [Anaerovibrio sp.]